jgi:hypothetical protein
MPNTRKTRSTEPPEPNIARHTSATLTLAPSSDGA